MEHIQPGDTGHQFVYVLEGSIRVTLLSQTGSQILLYRLTPSDSCVLTTSCLLNQSDSKGLESIDLKSKKALYNQ